MAGEEGCELSVRRSWGLVLAPMVLGKSVNLLQFSFFYSKMGIKYLPPGYLVWMK